MSNLTSEILQHWSTKKWGYSNQLLSLESNRWPAWSLNLPDGKVGVAIPYDNARPIAESFANAWLQSAAISNLADGNVLMLTSQEPSQAFATLCAEFVSPGDNGSMRNSICMDPTFWWKEWKSLLGNKNVEKRVFDVLGELISLATLEQQMLCPIWTGPDGSSTDIDCESSKYEVKSTLVRNSKAIEIHGLFQLSKDSAPKYLLFVQFEPSQTGFSINALVNHLCTRGFSPTMLNQKLAALGYPVGSSSRTKRYRLLGLAKYRVDDAFPHIEQASFSEGKLPEGVMSISYRVSLDGLDFEDLLPDVPEIA